MADVLSLAKNSLYGPGSLTSGAARVSSINSNINAAYSSTGLTPQRKILLDQAKSYMAQGNHQEAALRLWYILGSTGNKPVVTTSSKPVAVGSSSSSTVKKVVTIPKTSPIVVTSPQTASIKDTLGRDIKITASQAVALQNAAKSQASWQNFGRLPEEVANSQANWRINPSGQYEWEPVTASDKAHLAQINSQRRQRGLTPLNVLMTGAAKSDSYTLQWENSGGGGVNRASTNAKTEAKMAKLKGTTKATNNKNGSTGRAAIKKVDHTGQIQLKDRSWINQIQKQGNNSKNAENVTIYSSQKAYNETVKAKKEAAKKAAAHEARLVKNFKEVIGKNGVIDSIQVVGGIWGTGEQSVRVTQTNKAGKVTAASMRAVQYAKETDPEKVSRQKESLQKYLSGKPTSERDKYLLNAAIAGLPATGKASDVWTKLNTDVFTGKVDKKTASLVQKNGMADVYDNISKKQVDGKPLNAVEELLVERAMDGYKPTTNVNKFANYLDQGADILTNKMSGFLTPVTADRYKFAGNNAGRIAGIVNSLNAGAVDTPKMLSTGIGGLAKAADYVYYEGKKIKSVNSAKAALSTAAMAGAYYGTQIGRGTVKQAETDPIRFASSMALAEVAMGGAFKGASKVTKTGAKTAGVKSGLVRLKNVESDLIPYKEAGAILDDFKAGKNIEGTHSTVYPVKKGKNIHTTEPGLNPKYVEPHAFGKKGMFYTVADEFVDPSGKYFTSKPKLNTRGKAVEAVSKPISKAKSALISENKAVRNSDGTVSFVNSDKLISKAAKKAVKDLNSFKSVNKINETLNSLKIKSGTRVSKIRNTPTGKTANKYVEKPALKVANGASSYIKKAVSDYWRDQITRAPKRSEKVTYRGNFDPVKVPAKMWDKVYKKFNETGGFWDEYDTMLKMAQKQADKSGKPIAVPSPKLASGSHKGWLEAENEMYVVSPQKGVKVTSKQFLGYTPSGIKVSEVRYGKQLPIKKKSLATVMKENRAYNKQMFKAIDGKYYNLNHLKSYALDAERKFSELVLKNKTTRQRAYEGGSHGLKHGESLSKNLKKMGVDFKNSDFIGIWHDITKIGPHETPAIPHAVAAAEILKQGLIKDPLIKASIKDFVTKKNIKAIAGHTTVTPLNKYTLRAKIPNKVSLKELGKTIDSIKDISENLKRGTTTNVKTRPDKLAKKTANADRIDLAERFGVPLKKSKIFWDALSPEEKVRVSKLESLGKIKSKIGSKSLKPRQNTSYISTAKKASYVKPVTYSKPMSYGFAAKEMSFKVYGSEVKPITSYRDFSSAINGSYKVLNIKASPNYLKNSKPSDKTLVKYPKNDNKSGYKYNKNPYEKTYKAKPYDGKNYNGKPYEAPYKAKSYESGEYKGTPYKGNSYNGGSYNGGYTPSGYPVNYAHTPSGKGYTKGYNGSKIRVLPENPAYVAKKKKKAVRFERKKKEMVRLKRIVQNTLGTLKSTL